MPLAQINRPKYPAPIPRSFDDVLRYLEAHRDRTSFLTPTSWGAQHTPPVGGDYIVGWMRHADGG